MDTHTLKSVSDLPGNFRSAFSFSIRVADCSVSYDSSMVCVASSIGVSALWNAGVRAWIAYAVTGVIWFIGTLGLTLLPKYRVPKVWGVPLVPWLPSFSIAMNLFLIGSLGYVAFLRFIICSLVMLLYYLFVVLHATYDVAHQPMEEPKFEGER